MSNQATIQTVTTELISNNIRITGSYSKLPALTYRLVMNILHFGEVALTKSSLGSKVKEIALSLARKDNRKPVICSSTLKTVLA